MKVRKDTPHVKNKKGEYEWRGRIRWIGADGKERVKQRTANSKRHAKALADQLAGWLEREGPRAVDAEKLKFSELADEYKAKKLVPAVYAGDLRVAGERAYQRQHGFLKPLAEYFGSSRVQTITYEDLLSYRKARFQTPSRRGGQRSITQVNRELTLLRTIFNYARRCGYVARTPFEMGKGLIAQSQETQRDRIMTPEEEVRLLAQCVGRRAHLRAIVILAVDTAMRKGEIFQLRWMDVDLSAGVINVRSTTTKTRRGRQIGITGRVRAELECLLANRRRELKREVKPEELIFGGVKDCKRSFAGA